MPATRVSDPPAGVARSTERLERAHERARGRGESRALYVVVRFFVTPILRVWFRARISGADQIPAVGAVIVAPNHKSFLDAFFIGIATRRPVRYMVKTEVFRGPLGPLLLRLGAFPVRRGQADADALVTARTILGRGGVLVVFPEGTRVEDPHALGSPHHGAGRLALETGAPVVPAAITGTDHLWWGPIARPRRVQLAFLPPLDPCRLAGRSDALTELVDHELWPSVLAQYGRQAHAEPQLLGVIEPLNVRRHRRLAAPTPGTGASMLRQGPLSVSLHSAAEPFLVALLIGAPFLFGFDDVGAPTALAIIAGLLILVVSMSTCWRLSLVKVIPLGVHATLDVLLGLLLVASPFVFGFSDDSGAATAFFILFGVTEVLATLATRWTADDSPRVARRPRDATSTPGTVS